MEFYLNRRQALFIATKAATPTAIEITIELVRRFDAYESGGRVRPAVNLKDRGQLLAISVALVRELEASQDAVAALAPKAAALDRLAAKCGAENITDTAKTLAMRPTRLFNWLAEHRWIFRRADGAPWRGFQDKIDAGLLVHVETPDRNREDRTFTACMVTPKGRARLAALLEGEKEGA